MTILRLLLLAAVMLASLGAARADDYPSRTIRVIVTIPPGGAPDVSARLIGQYLSEELGQPVVIENRTGANGNIGGEQVAKSPPDGYTLLINADSGFVINPHVYSKMAFDPIKDLEPVASIATNQFMLGVNNNVPVKTFQEFIDYARAANPPMAYASGGNGSQHQFAMEMLKQQAGINLLHVPFRGGAPAMTATIAGDVQALFAGASSGPQLKAGLLRPLAASGKRRSPRFPELPTVSEFYPGTEVDIWIGLFAPAGTPEPIKTRLRTEVHKILSRPDVAEKLNVSGSLEPLILSPEDFSALIQRDYEKYGKLTRALKIKLD